MVGAARPPSLQVVATAGVSPPQRFDSPVQNVLTMSPVGIEMSSAGIEFIGLCTQHIVGLLVAHLLVNAISYSTSSRTSATSGLMVWILVRGD